MAGTTKNILKYLLILFILALLIYAGYILFSKYRNQASENLKDSNQSQPATTENAMPDQGVKSAPVLLNNEEKKKYGVKTDAPVYLEMIEGSKDLGGSLPRLILPPEALVGPPPEINVKK